MIWIAALLLASILFTLIYGSFAISSGIYLRSLCRRVGVEDKIAITFDDGIDPQITPKVLATLSRYGAKATFFIVGQRAEQHPQIVEEIVRQGHTIGNHSHYHRGSFPMQSRAQIASEITQCNTVLEQITKDKITLFRPPFGVTNPMVGGAVRDLGLISVGWSIRSLDTLGQPLERVLRRVVGALEGGKVILLHDNRQGAEILLESILIEIEARGLKCVTINELFNV
ncbi:MAG: polysaccharide deacetylase family protein [Rikenellaceae bacterium]